MFRFLNPIKFILPKTYNLTTRFITSIHKSPRNEDVSEFLTQPKILKKIISTCYLQKLPGILELPGNFGIYAYGLEQSSKNLLNNIKISLHFIYPCKCVKEGGCECKFFDPFNKEGIAINCAYYESELLSRKEIKQDINFKYIVFLSEKNIGMDILKNVILDFAEVGDEKILVHNSDLSLEEYLYLQENKINSIKLGKMYSDWLRNKNSIVELEF